MGSTKKVNWVPSYGMQQELDWLQNMEDWMISKKRYWGLALPIWECKECSSFDVIGGEEELKARAVEGWSKFEGHTPHRPWIDYVKIACPKCGALMSRIKDVGNPWLDAGIVAYSTLSYRQNRKYWEKWFPADFICESLPCQFRNWFYSMLTMSTILEREPPFLTCLGYGSVLAEDGREMHKSWGNAIWFDDAAESMGADVMRWMYCSNKAEINLLFGYNGADVVRKTFFIPLWNVYSFFVTYANLDKWTPRDSTNHLYLLDSWVLSKLHILTRDVTSYLNNYDVYASTLAIQQFVEELSTWYIRRSRRRFWKSDSDDDKKAAYTTLYTCLVTLDKLLAPFLPFITEEIYQNLVRSVSPDAPESVHHCDWPEADTSLIDKELTSDMSRVIKVSSLGRSARNLSGIKLRQPLAESKIVAGAAILKRLRKFKGLIAEELNVKEVSLTSREDALVNYTVKPLPSILGKKYGSLFPEIRDSISKMNKKTASAAFKAGRSVGVKIEGKVVSLLPEEVEVGTETKEGWAVAQDEGIMIGVNTTLAGELANEGIARDIVRRIQNQRKEAGFRIADEIITYYEAGPKLTEVFEFQGDYIASETLSKALYREAFPENAFVAEFELSGEKLRIGIVQIENEKK